MEPDGPAACKASRSARIARPDIASDGIVQGSIQIPGDGQPIVLSAERQTTGGYPKIGAVISADLPALGRLGPEAWSSSSG